MTPTVFESLQSKAEVWFREFEKYKSDCQIFSEKLRLDFLEYLGATSEDIQFHPLDEHLDRVRDASFGLSPVLQIGDDGFFYFGLTLFFRMKNRCVDEHMRIGVQKNKAHWRVRWNQSEMNYDGANGNVVFFKKLTDTISGKFGTYFHKVKGPLGFIPVLNNDHLTLVPPAEVRVVAEASQPIKGENMG